MSRGWAALRQLAAARPLHVPERPFLFLRHGETAGNRDRIFQRPDEPLNATGLEQARQAADALHGLRPERIVASPMRRARQTAGIVAGAFGLEVIEAPGLRERSFGALIGTSSVALDWASTPPGGEAPEEFVVRTHAALGAALGGADRTLIVAHGGTLLVLTAALGCTFAPEIGRNATPLLFTPGAAAWGVSPLLAVPKAGEAVFT